MRHNLRIDILMMLLFIIFGGSLAKGQNPLFGKPLTGEDGNPGGSVPEKVECIDQNREGQFCFKSTIYFADLDIIVVEESNTGKNINQAVFPCDLHIGVKIGNSTIFTSLSEGVEYHHFEGDRYVHENYSAEINLGCFDSQDINYAIYGTEFPPVLSEEDCELVNGQIGVPGSMEFYCKTSNGMIPLDLCDDYDLFSHLFFGPENPGLCSLGSDIYFRICCEANNSSEISFGRSSDSKPLNYSSYRVFDFNGVLQSSGKLNNVNSLQQAISVQNIKNGIYIIVLTSTKGHKSSYKFVSFK